ncbi:MAG: hypothetical protein JWL78_931, partial [Chloroflexi bacterium]|nr:hypothetical protein [Chloroflexota bacterium]
TITAPWTLANVPSAGTLSSVSVSGAVATLTLTEGAGAADTSAGSFTTALATNAAGNRDAAGNLSSFASTPVVDRAAPALLTLQMLDANANGKVDQVKATFSETLAASTLTAPWTLASVPSAGTLSSFAVSGAVATLTLTEGAGAADTSVGSFTVALATNASGIRDAAANLSSFAATAPADGAVPVRVTLQMFDTNGNGKIDQVKATFSETLASYTAGNTPWTLANVPSAGTLSSVAVSGAVATLTLNAGAGAANTAVGSFTVALASNAAGIRDAAGNLSSFAATAPADKAPPILVSASASGGTAGLMESGDTMTLTFSETLSGVPTSATVLEKEVSGVTQLTIATMLNAATISNTYIQLGTGTTAQGSSTASITPFGATIFLSLGTVTVSGNGSGGGVAAGTGSAILSPASTLHDAAANAAVTTTTATATRLF